MQRLQRPEEDIRSPGAGVVDGYEPSCGCWELNSGPLQEQQILLMTEQVLFNSLFICLCVYVSELAYTHVYIGVRTCVCAHMQKHQKRAAASAFFTVHLLFSEAASFYEATVCIFSGRPETSKPQKALNHSDLGSPVFIGY